MDPLDPRRQSTFMRIVNPELYTKPNPRIAIAGTTLFVLVLSSLLYEKHRYNKEQQRLKEQKRDGSTGLHIREEDHS